MNEHGRTRLRLAAMILTAVLLISMASPAMAEVFSAIVTSGSMTVYSDAKLTRQTDTLEQDTVVRVQAYSGKAAKIAYDGGTGYASISDMRAVDNVALKALATGDAHVYASASRDAKSVELPEGTRIYVLSFSGDWARVEKDGKVGYMLLTELEKVNSDWSTGPAPTPTPPPTEPGIVTASTLPVYKKESASSGKLGTLKGGQTVDVISWTSKWAYILFDGKYGYCAVKGLARPEEVETEVVAKAAETTKVTVTASKLTVYKLADSDSQTLGTLKKGMEVNLISRVGDWCYIELSGNYGYAAASGLSVSSEPAATVAPTPTPSVANAAKGTVNVASLTVYRTASTKGEKADTLKKGDKVNVIKWNADWAYIEYNGKYGFCAVTGLTRTEVSPTPPPTATPKTSGAVKATVSAEKATVYRTAGESAAVLGTLEWGEAVNVISVSDGWAYIERDGNYGFCKSASLSRADDAPTPAPAPTGYVTADFSATVISPSARAYASASTSAESRAVLLGSEVYVNGYSKDLKWAAVEQDGARAYMLINDLNRATYPTVTGAGAAAQTLLKALLEKGYYDGPLTASATSDMALAAVKRFQAECGLTESGAADQTVQRILYGGSAPACEILVMSMSQGSIGQDVTRLQTRLYVLGYLGKAESMDGDYGSTTAAAVALFQQANGLTASGVADGVTLKALYSASANGKPSSVSAADGAAAPAEAAVSTASTASTGSTSSSGVVTPPSRVTLSSTYQTTMPSALKSKISSYSSSLSNAQKLEYAIYVAQSNLTKPYVFGATGPKSFDCSGLTQYCFKKAGVSIKRTAYSQGYDTAYSKISSVSGLKRGDLVFFNTISDSDLSDHVGIYLGGGCFIHASSGGHKVVVSNIASGYYNRVFSWGRRILK